MAYKSGFSHGCSAIIAVVLGEILIIYLHDKLKGFVSIFDWISKQIVIIINKTLNLNLDPHTYSPIIFIFIITFIWGIAYHIIRDLFSKD